MVRNDRLSAESCGALSVDACNSSNCFNGIYGRSQTVIVQRQLRPFGNQFFDRPESSFRNFPEPLRLRVLIHSHNPFKYISPKMTTPSRLATLTENSRISNAKFCFSRRSERYFLLNVVSGDCLSVLRVGNFRPIQKVVLFILFFSATEEQTKHNQPWMAPTLYTSKIAFDRFVRCCFAAGRTPPPCKYLNISPFITIYYFSGYIPYHSSPTASSS